ncbi:RHS repeat domain-containing protein, partial [Acinetobacter sp. TGL-Y2]|uniref:RHS repeat domain-containing protein n=1 Tax=Acinetobacter sp. TGL-Y2 TaxID=1407071 RepID=UPI001D0E50E4
YKDPVWKTDTRKNKAEFERVAFYHCDQVGTPQTLSNELGECIWEIKQDTWGTALEIKATEEDNPFGYSNIRFQGQYYDKETGLHYNRYRYYEPYSARYVSKDPIGLLGGLHSTKYVSDPNQWVDPMGLQNQKNKNAEDYTKAKGLMIASEERALKANLRIIEEAKAKKERIDRSLKEESLKNAKVAAEKKARQNLTYNPSGLGRDRELDRIDRVNKCTINQTCTIDYVTLGGGLGPWSMSASINTHNGDIFFSPINISPKSGGDLILALGDLAFKATPLGLSNSYSVSLMLGRMQNIEGISRSIATSSFLEGEAFTLSSTPYKLIPASGAVTVSGADLKSNPSQIFNKPYAKEGGFIFNGSIIDLNRSNSYKVK